MLQKPSPIDVTVIGILKQTPTVYQDSSSENIIDHIAIMNGSINVGLHVFPNASGTSSNNTSTDSCPFVPIGNKEFKVAIHSVTLVVSLVGNCLLIAAFVRMKEPVMLLIANMAASDLLTTIFYIPRLLVIEISRSYAWKVPGIAGTVLCKMCNFLADISIAVSTQSLMLIAIERFLAVVYPLKTRSITPKNRRFLIASTWIVSMVLHAPYFYVFELYEDKLTKTLMCQHLTSKLHYLLYRSSLFIIVLFIPLIVVIILYTITLVKLRVDKMSEHRSTRGERRSRKRTVKLLKLASATVLAMFICWTTFTVITFLKLFVLSSAQQCTHIFQLVDFSGILLTSCYCAVNPSICFFFLRNFRGQLRQMCKLTRRRAFNVYRENKAGRSRANTSVTILGMELLHATPKLSSSCQSTSE